jgi:2-amino-4-hydroxy-6-hydroxymethyldihydropteridine diphosphokinase
MLLAMTIAAIALGSNLGKRQAALRAALSRLRQVPATRLLALSTFRQTAPVDAPSGSPAFINAACTVETSLSAEGLLEHLLAIERSLGRVRDPAMPNAPRVIDLDLLLYGNLMVGGAELTVPHPRMHLRRFVLEPLAEIAPDLVHPILGKTVHELLTEARSVEPAASATPDLASPRD